ncbi:hypothetical protein MKW92_019321 [Papaver armeniacum]|nr:hypothetical protein MKW92_019321 [Papaver armeniacum]
MESQPTDLSENQKYHFRMFINYQEEGIDINNRPQGFSLDSPILIKDYSENRLSNQELNLIDSFNVDSSSSTEHNAYEESETELKKTADNQELIRSVYSCNYCQKKFFSWQALGGHQNAQKQERVVEKRDRLQRLSSFHYDNMVMSNHQQSDNRRSCMASLPPLFMVL